MNCLPSMRLMALKVMMNRLRNVENCQKLENCLSSENRLSQEKNCQKLGIYLISTLKRTGHAF